MADRQVSLEDVGVAVRPDSFSRSSPYVNHEGEELAEKQRDLVDKMRRAAWKTAVNGKPVSSIAEHRVADIFAEILKLKNKRNAAVRRGDVERAHELNEEMGELQRELKRAGLPYHPARHGNRDDYARLKVRDR